MTIGKTIRLFFSKRGIAFSRGRVCKRMNASGAFDHPTTLRLVESLPGIMLAAHTVLAYGNKLWVCPSAILAHRIAAHLDAVSIVHQPNRGYRRPASDRRFAHAAGNWQVARS